MYKWYLLEYELENGSRGARSFDDVKDAAERLQQLEAQAVKADITLICVNN